MFIKFKISNVFFALIFGLTLSGCGGGEDFSMASKSSLASAQAENGSATPTTSNVKTKSNGQDEAWSSEKKDVAVFFAMGQSNSVSRSYLSSGDRITKDLSNVFIARAVKSNLTLDNTKPIIWENFSTDVAGNVMGKGWGRNETDDKNLANSPAFIAQRWQQAIDFDKKNNNGKTSIPDLYIAHVAIGGQSISCSGGDNAWCPTQSRRDIGNLYLFSQSIVKRTMQTLTKSGYRPRLVGLDWNQWESDSGTSDSLKYAANLNTVISALTNAAGVAMPIWLHKPPLPPSQTNSTANPSGKQTIINQINIVMKAEPSRYTLIDPQEMLELLQMNVPPSKKKTSWEIYESLFFYDRTHYNAATQKLMAGKIWEDINPLENYGMIPEQP